VGLALKSSSLLHLEVSRARVSQYGLKTGAGAAWLVHVASSWKLHQIEAEDVQVDKMGCVRLCYPYFVILIILGPRDILVGQLLPREERGPLILWLGTRETSSHFRLLICAPGFVHYHKGFLVRVLSPTVFDFGSCCEPADGSMVGRLLFLCSWISFP
jgi:hypothetical protein